MYVVALKASKMGIYLLRIVQVAFLQTDKALTKILFDYLDYADVFFANFVIRLPEHNSINDYAIKLAKAK